MREPQQKNKDKNTMKNNTKSLETDMKIKTKRDVVEEAMSYFPIEYRVGEIGENHRKTLGVIWDSITKKS